MALILPATGTLLVLTPLSGSDAPQLTPYSARGITQTLELIQAGGGGGGAVLRRDVNGFLRSVADTRFRKYHSSITCRDGAAPALDDAWIGLTVECSCAVELSYSTGGVPRRPAVSGSVRTESGFTFYRPILICLVENIKVSFAEWPATVDWTVDLQEI